MANDIIKDTAKTGVRSTVIINNNLHFTVQYFESQQSHCWSSNNTPEKQKLYGEIGNGAINGYRYQRTSPYSALEKHLFDTVMKKTFSHTLKYIFWQFIFS